MTDAADRRPCVVVGYDGSAPAREAVRYAARRAGEGGRVVLVYAFHPPPDHLGTPFYERHLTEHEGHGRAVLDEILRSGDPALAGRTVEDELVGGPPAETIARVARVHDADEIVVGSRGHGRLGAVIGSVAQGLLHLADRPVVVLPQGYLDARPSR